MTNDKNISRQKIKQKQPSAKRRAITVQLPVEIKNLIDKEREITGETIGKIIERAIIHLFDSDRGQASNKTHQEPYVKQMLKIADVLREIVNRIDKIAAKQTPDKHEQLKVVVISKKHAWENHPQKKQIYQMVRDMHKVGANSTMIASGLNIEGFKTFTGEKEWKIADVKKIVEEIKKESDYLPPLYSMPD